MKNNPTHINFDCDSADLDHLFKNNREWVQKIYAEDPSFFKTLARSQKPDYLWIGCSDSRVPVNEMIGLQLGEVFVHRNIANQVIPTDTNCLSVIQYAVDSLKVTHIVVCGHYNCGGVIGAIHSQPHGVIDRWLQPIRDICKKHDPILDVIDDEKLHIDKLCELNVIEQVANVCRTTTVQNAWRRGQELVIHGWIYRLEDGQLCDLNVCVRSIAEFSSF